MKISAWTVLFSTLGLVAASCSNGGGGTGGTGGQITSCGSLQWDQQNEACSQCMTASCCAQLAACDTGSACAALFDCLAHCTAGDTTCTDGCRSTHADGVSAAAAATKCFDQKCQPSAACGAQVCDSGLYVVDSGCAACIGGSCCTEWKLCAADATCRACIGGASGSGCDGNDLADAALTCADAQCSTQCASNICDSGLATGTAACNGCLGLACCAEIDACAGEAACKDCLLTGGAASSCADNATYQTAQSCWTSQCAGPCGG